MINPMVLCTSNRLHGRHLRDRTSLCKGTRNHNKDTPSKCPGATVREDGTHVSIANIRKSYRRE